MRVPGVGLDLGTLFSAVAVSDAAGDARILPDRLGCRRTPSVVTISGSRASVGDRTPQAIRLVKATVGDPLWRFPAGGMSLRAEEVVALILGRLADDAGRALGHPVSDPVLTVPACFDAVARHAVRQAGQIAGLAVRRIVDEPTAAALTHADRLVAGELALVFALGAGVCEASVLRREDAGLRVLATRGDRDLGGCDWDNTLLRIVDGRHRSAGGSSLLRDPDDESRLRQEVERAKHTLTDAGTAEVRLGRDGSLIVSRPEFEQATAGLLDRARGLVGAVLSAASSAPADVHVVLPVGGPTRMPMVRGLLDELFGRRVADGPDPQDLVALGAALSARPDAPPVTEISAYGLGMLARDPATGVPRNVVVLPAGTALPGRRRDVFSPIETGQRQLVLDVTEGDDDSPTAVRRLHREVVDLPAGLTGPIEVTYAYDVDRCPHVEVRHVASGRFLTGFDAVGPDALSAAEVSAAAERFRVLTG